MMTMAYLADETSSSSLGSLLVTITPRFILAGSSAQFDIPIKATRLVLSILYRVK